MTIKNSKLLIVFLGIFFLAVVWFYFVPAFRGLIPVKPDFYLGPVRLHWYGLVLAGAILAGFLVAARLGPRFGISAKMVESVLPWIVLSGFFGARAYFVAFDWNYFQANPQDILAFWKGGISIYGGIIGAALAGAFFANDRKLSVMGFLDVAAVSAVLGQAIGRFGNFFNSEAFGRPTALPWGMYIPENLRPVEYVSSKFFHPAFLYESLWNFVVFLILVYLSQKFPEKGVLAGMYLVFYGLGRFFVESLRLDSFFLYGIRVDQVTSLVAMTLGSVFIFFAIRNANQKSS